MQVTGSIAAIILIFLSMQLDRKELESEGVQDDNQI